MPDSFETILHRRSIRRFAPKQMEEAALQQICGSGTFPPTAMPSCSFFWATPKRATSTPPRSREKRGA